MKLQLLKNLSYVALVSFPGLIFAVTTATSTPSTVTTSTTASTTAVTSADIEKVTAAEMANLKRQVSTLNTKTNYLEAKVERLEQEEVESSRHSSRKTAKASHDADPDDVESSRETSMGRMPRFGIGADVFGDDLYIHDFGLNRDLQLLLQKEYIQQNIGSFNGDPRILVSGLLTGKASSHTSDAFGIYEKDNGQKFDAASAIDFSAFVSDWWLGYFEMDGDTAGDVTIDQIFVTLGNLDEFPAYGTLGFIYVPNGSYRTKMITDSLPQKLARTRESTALAGFDYAGFDYSGFNGAIYVMSGEPQDTETNRMNQWGANLAYRKVARAKGAFAYDLGVSFMNDIATSSGISGALPDDIILERYVPAFNLRGKAGINRFYGLAEYVFAVGSFDQADVVDLHIADSGMYVDSSSVKPEAGHLELGINFNALETPMTLALAYDQTHDSLAFGLPKQQYGSTLEMGVYKNTIVSLEYTQLRDYDEDDAATMFGDDGIGTIIVEGTGELDKVVRMQVDVYF